MRSENVSVEDLLNVLFGNSFDEKNGNLSDLLISNKAKKIGADKPTTTTTSKAETKCEIKERYDGYKMEVVRDDSGNKKGIKLMFCVPGLSMEQISVTEENGTVKVKSSVKVPFFGELCQSTHINEIYDIRKLTAKLKNGVLTIEAPICSEPIERGRKITIE